MTKHVKSSAEQLTPARRGTIIKPSWWNRLTRWFRDYRWPLIGLMWIAAIVLGYIGCLAEIHRQDAGHGDDAAGRQFEVAGDQNEGDADADDDDVPVVGDQVDQRLALGETGYE